jgi:hypothetical protein
LRSAPIIELVHRHKSQLNLASLLFYLMVLLLASRAGGRDANVPAPPTELFRHAKLTDFVAAATAESADYPRNVPWQLARAEAYLANGQPNEADHTLRPFIVGPKFFGRRYEDVTATIKLWTTARLRQGELPIYVGFDRTQRWLSQNDSGYDALRLWSQELAGQSVYQVSGESPAYLPLKQSVIWSGLNSKPTEGVEISINGVAMPLAFIDTGAQYTIISSTAAQQAGVVLSDDGSKLIGFASSTGWPGVVKELQLGSLVVRNVPVFVSDNGLLAKANSSAALGIDLLSHLRVTIDYPRQAVHVESSTTQATTSDDAWRIPLWTFSQACLAQGDLPNGKHARVLIDTGNRLGTFASERWARANLPKFYVPTSKLLPWFKHRGYEMVGLELGGRKLPNWPIRGILPAEFEQLDLVDLLLGYDLLKNYRATFDLRRRVLELRPSEEPDSTVATPSQ